MFRAEKKYSRTEMIKCGRGNAVVPISRKRKGRPHRVPPERGGPLPL